MTGRRPTVDTVTTSVVRFPTPEPEADGTLEWDATTLVAAHVGAGGRRGLGWTYSTPAAATVIEDVLATAVDGRDAHDVPGCWEVMHRAARNLGTKGLVMQAISAVDIALWDLEARLLDVPLSRLLGACRSRVPVHGSGGFTSLTESQLADQVDAWAADGCTAMKIKIGESWGRSPERDLARVEQLASRAGPSVALMVDANGAYSRAEARRVGRALDEIGVVWFEEPVSSDDGEGLAAVRSAVRCDVAAGEYASDVYDAERLCAVVDCLQLDATRCGGYTGWLRCAAVAAAHNLQVSAHCAPALHTWVAAAVPHLRHVEYFVDHVRLESRLVRNAPAVEGGCLVVPYDRPGHGMSLDVATDADGDG